MKLTAKLLTTILILTLASCQNANENKHDFGKFEVKRGTNIAHFLSQSNNRGEERKAFFTQEDVKTIASLGFDHIRLPIDEEQMWDEEGNRHDDAFELMHNAIEWAADAGLRVIVDLHILRSHHFNEGEKPLWTDRAEQEKFFALWKDLSSFLKDTPTGQVAYELMNEAVAEDPEQWNKLLNEAFEVIRNSEPERTIVIGSNLWQSASTFHQLRIPENDPDILLSFHFYMPFALTHHEAGWTSIKDYHGPVHYPGEVVETSDLEGLPEKLAQQLKADGDFYTRDTLKALMQEPLEYAKKYKLPLYCGEFGVYDRAPREDAIRWYKDMISVLEENNIAWANWAYKGSFSIYTKNGNPDTELLDQFFQNISQL